MVIVIGAMKPAIHHPQWYRAINAIDDDELAASLKMPSSGTTPIASRLQFGSPILTVACNPAQWLIHSTEAASWERMLKITSLVFAKANDPALTAYGFTAQRHIDTNATDTKSLLADCLNGLHLGLPVGKSSSSNISLSIDNEDYTISTSIQPSVIGDRTVFVFYNHHYQAQDINAILDGRFERFSAEAGEFFTDVVSAINARAREG